MKRGLSLHKRAKHEEVYHRENVPAPRTKARWEYEEMVLMAREEAQLLRDGFKNINQKLKAILPYRTLESIKGVLRKANKKYQDLLSEFISETKRGSETDTSSCSNVEPSQCGAEESGTAIGFSGREYEEWVRVMMQEIEGGSFYTDIEMELCHRGLTDDVRWAIDLDFQKWLESEGVSVRGRRRARCPASHPKRRPQLNAAKRRKATYQRVQNLFRKNKTRCAKEVLQGTWNCKGDRCTLPELEAYWRKIFEQESVPDERTPDLIGPVRWELIRPVSKTELEATIMNMRPGAPGPDGMVLHRLKQLPKEELRARLNLWLMVGHCPTRCCIGETVMIPKDLDDVRPPKHRLITMADMIIRCFHKLMGKRMADLLPISERQKAFRSGDGSAENVCCPL